jgi:hypothetical protein
MKRKMPTLREVVAASVKSDRAALKISIKKYDYLRNLSSLPTLDNTTWGCALCARHTDEGTCPLRKNCRACIPEFYSMCVELDNENLDGFKKYANKMYKKLVKALGKIK